MKLFRYLISALAGVALFASCIEEEPVSSFDLAIDLDKSVVAVGSEGGSATVTVNSGDVSWTAKSNADWIVFTPASGKGETKITVTIGAYDEDRTGEIVLAAANLEVYLTVIQTGNPHGLTEDDPLTCAEAVAICEKLDDKAKTPKKYFVKGIISQVIEEFGTTYGNATFWMGDTGEDKLFQVYRAYYLGNVKYDDPSKQNIGLGDEVVIHGLLMNYGGTPETSQNEAYVFSLKSNTDPVITCKETEKVVGASDTEATFTISAKNLTENWTVTTDASWIKDYTKSGSMENTEIKVYFDANTDTNPREATFTVKSAGAKEVVLTLKQGGYTASGTLDKPYTVAEIIAAIKDGTAAGNVYIKGIISKAVYTYSASFNTGTFWISDDGVFNDNLDMDFECYSVYWVGGTLEAPVAAADIKGNYAVGDEVVIYGATTAYTKNDVTTYETSSKKAKIYSINWATTDENGLGNVDYPFNIAGAKKFIDDTQAALAAAKAAGETLTLPDVAVAGKVSELVNGGFDPQYGNGTFWISDDGSAKDFEAYRVMYLENISFEDGMTNVAVGDEVILKGQLTKYGDTYETSSKKAFLYSLNGVTEAQSGPVDNFDYTPGAEYESADNLWKKVDTDKAAKFFYSSPAGSATDAAEYTYLTLKNSTYKLSFPEATDGRWANQFFIFPGDAEHFVALNPGKKYSFKLTLQSDAAFAGFFKLVNYKADGNHEGGPTFWETPGYPDGFTFVPGEPIVLETEIAGKEAENLTLIFDFGGNPANSNVYIKDITLIQTGVVEVENPVDVNWSYTPSDKYAAATNLWKPADNAHSIEWYYAPNWTPVDAPQVNFTQSTYEFTLGTATAEKWQAQMWVLPTSNIVLDAEKKYNVYVTVGSTLSINAYFKFYQKGDDAHYVVETEKPVAAGETITIALEEITPHDGGINTQLLFACGGNRANTKVYIKDITIEEAGAQAAASKNIGELLAAIPDTAVSNATAVELPVEFDNPVTVSYVNGKNAYLEDSTGAILLYMEGHGLQPGVTLKGNLTVKVYKFNGLPEIVAFTGTPTVGAGTIPETAVTIAQLNADYGKYMLRRVKLTGVTVTDGIADGDRNGEIAQGDDKIKVYAQLPNQGLVLTQGDQGDFITIPGIYNTTKQVYLWDNAWFTKAAAPTGMAIDGDFSDWDGIEAFSSEATSRIREWKFASDADNVYVYIALRKNRVDSGRKLVIGFDIDATGTLTDNNKMKDAEAIARNIIPFTNASGASELTVVTGADAGSEVVSASGETATGAVNVWAVAGTEDMSSDSSNAYLELSIPKAKLGLPASGTIKVGASYDYYFAGWNEITL